jgi:hypothetical protein
VSQEPEKNEGLGLWKRFLRLFSPPEEEEPQAVKAAAQEAAAPARGRARPGRAPQPRPPAPQPDLNFNWFTLITIPDAQQTPRAFNERVAGYINKELSRRGALSFLELYLSEEAMHRLVNDMGFEDNRDALLKTINAQLPGQELDSARGEQKVSLFPEGLLITPALKQLFANSFVARHLMRPQVHTPTDDSKIPYQVKQYLIGELEVENQHGVPLGTTPIRALVQNEKANEGIFRVSMHADFDLILKAFPNKEFCACPLGVNITCSIKEGGTTGRPLQRVSLDIHDMRLFEQWCDRNSHTQFAYSLITGRNVVTDINDFPDDVVPVEDFTSEFSTAVARNFPVPVNRRIGLKVSLRHRVRGQNGDRDDIVTYKYLFRFFENALTYRPGFNKVQGTGQFVRRHGETTVMLPPLARDGKSETQTPALIITPQTSGPAPTLRIRKHPDSELALRIGSEPLTADGVEVELDESVKIEFTPPGGGSSTFVVQPLDKVSAERREVSERRRERDYVAFVEINSERVISLMLNEIILGRGHFLNRQSGVDALALTLKRSLVQWEMLAGGGEEVLYYSTNVGTVITPLTRVEGVVRLDLVGTYYVYVGDFEFMVYLESTPGTELVITGRR